MALEKTDRNREIYEKHFGINGEKPLSYDQLGKHYKLHQNTVRNIVIRFKAKYGKNGA